MTVELRPFGVACNIACHYCYQNPMRDAGNIWQSYNLERMKTAIQREGGPFTLFGGEPLLMPLVDLEELWRWGLEKYGSNSVQTNGILIKDEHLRLFKTYRVQVGVSIDGPGDLNDLRRHGSLEQTRRSTALTIANIERLCREYQPPGLIVTLHRINATMSSLPRLLDWVRQMDTLGVRSMRLHLLEVESEEIRRTCSLSKEENVHALLRFAELESELKHLRFDVLDEMGRNLLGQDLSTSCVWHACDPYTTPAVRGIEGNGQSSNCGRTNKDGIDFIKAEQPGFERYIALYQTPQEHGGCQGCRFFLMCKSQCPGTAIDGDWRNRSEFCGVWQHLFSHLEQQLLRQNEAPLSVHPLRQQLEQNLLALWQRGNNSTLRGLLQSGEAVQDDIMAGPGESNVLDGHAASGFHLPPFVRSTFVGEAQRDTWVPRINAVRSALARLGVLAVARKLAPATVVSVEQAKVFSLHTFAAAHDLHTYLLPGQPRTRWVQVVVGRHEVVGAYRRALLEESAEVMDELTGVPDCCRRMRERHRQAGYFDPIWLIATDGLPAPAAAGSTADVQCSPMLNTLLWPLGLDLLGYLPCSLICAQSRTYAETRLALGQEADMQEVLGWLEAMLDWPAEWSALHGIAEVKTGIVKFAYRTDYTPEKLTLYYHGHALAPDAMPGLTFVHRQLPRRRRNRVFQQQEVTG